MKRQTIIAALIAGLIMGRAVFAQDPASTDLPISSGQTIAFLGDSITAAGAKPGGYCLLVIDGLKRQGVEVKGVFAGISGHKSNQMLARLDRDVISKKPDWMTLSCGVNDVWHGARGVKLEDYKKNITAIVDQAQAAGIKVMILTSTMIKEDQSNALNQKLAGYNDFLRSLAREKGCRLADLNQAMRQALNQFPKDASAGNRLTRDGVHMNAYGNIMMAKGILKAFGLSDAALEACETAWKNTPGSYTMRLNLSMSLNEYEQLQKKLDKPVEAFFIDTLNEAKAKLLNQ